MRWALVLVSMTLACGSEHADPVRAPEPAPAPLPPTSAPADEPPPQCTSSDECTFSMYPLITDSSQCACPSCQPQASSVAELDVIAERYESICPGYYAAHGCHPPQCPSRIAVCIDGRCVGEPIADSGRGEPSPCQHPGECPERVRCVTTALGGWIGCTNEACCDSAECSNGCETDADCPACRPSCVRGGCGL